MVLVIFGVSIIGGYEYVGDLLKLDACRTQGPISVPLIDLTAGVNAIKLCSMVISSELSP